MNISICVWSWNILWV